MTGVGDPGERAGAGVGGTTSAIGQRRSAARAAARAGYGERRAQIVQAAATLFRERGYDGTTLGDIAEAVGADRATLYYYVGGKAEIFDELVTDLVEQGLAEVEAIRGSDDPAPVKLHRLITAVMASYARHYPFLYVYLQENLAHVGDERREWAQRMRAINRRWEAAVEAMVQQGMDDGSLRPLGDARTIAFGLVGTVSWTYRWWNPSASPLDAATIGQTYADLMLGGLVARA